MPLSIILSIAGSDCSGGAGIQADIKTISALGGYAASAITAITAQNTLGVQSVHPLPPEMVKAQIISVMDDLRPTAVKIGMVHDTGIVSAIVSCLKRYRPQFVVYDPVMISTSGRHLMTEETIRHIQTELFPLCTLITPNLGEASLLWGQTIASVAEMQQAARELGHRYHTHVLIKGGHLAGEEMCDVLYTGTNTCPTVDPHPTDCLLYSNPKIASRNLHRTGCTLSSAIATLLASGNSLNEAVRQAKAYIVTAISRGKEMNIGHGNGPLWHFPLP
ncbi:MAG: bifunctional hydroxymethylpyrimidine kinase/phosphomethylpyrimidine kinase [Bacteroides sp.]|nr:bifunctional hydroxymethylpyrimidine kinase/phosphomethylpyrimidine kinase [Bacteroides sp.]